MKNSDTRKSYPSQQQKNTLCKYDPNCKRPNCWYIHTKKQNQKTSSTQIAFGENSKLSSKSSQNGSKISQKGIFDSKGSKNSANSNQSARSTIKCKSDIKKSDVKCHYGDKCEFPACKFLHPWDLEQPVAKSSRLSQQRKSQKQQNKNDSENQSDVFDDLEYVEQTSSNEPDLNGLEKAQQANNKLYYPKIQEPYQSKSVYQPTSSENKPVYPDRYSLEGRTQFYQDLSYQNVQNIQYQSYQTNQTNEVQYPSFENNFGPEVMQNNANSNLYQEYQQYQNSEYQNSEPQYRYPSHLSHYNMTQQQNYQGNTYQNQNYQTSYQPYYQNENSNLNMKGNQQENQQSNQSYNRKSRKQIFTNNRIPQESDSESDVSEEYYEEPELITSASRKKHLSEIKEQKKPKREKAKGLFKELFQKVTSTFSEDPKEKAAQNLKAFCDEFKVSDYHRFKILDMIERRNMTPQRIQDLIKMMRKLHKEGYGEYFCFSLMAKVILSKKFNEENIVKNLNQKKGPAMKKRQKQAEFQSKYPDPKPIEFLILNDLLDLDSKKTIFLIDGNNVLVTNGKLRKYFQNQDPWQKAESQIRLNWIVGQTLQGYLFFDDEFNINVRKDIQNEVVLEGHEKFLNPKQPENKIEVIYPPKDGTADDMIVDKLISIHHQYLKTKKEETPEIILVTADRQLTQRCLDIQQIKKTSGKYFIQYAKKMIKHKYYGDNSKRGIIKRIFTYRF